MQQEDATAALAGDDVLEAAAAVGDQRTHQILLVLGQHQLVKRIITEGDGSDVAEGKATPLLGHEGEALDVGIGHPQRIIAQLVDGMIVIVAIVLVHELRVGARIHHHAPVGTHVVPGPPLLHAHHALVLHVMGTDRHLGKDLAALGQPLLGLRGHRMDRQLADLLDAGERTDANVVTALHEVPTVGAHVFVCDLQIGAEHAAAI